MHTVAACSLIVLPWSLILRLLLIALVGLSLGYSVRPPRVIGLRLAGRDRLECLLADGDRVAAKLLPDSTVFTWLIVLRLCIGEEERVSSLVLLTDQMLAEQFRLLRLWLRWHAEPKEDDGAAF